MPGRPFVADPPPWAGPVPVLPCRRSGPLTIEPAPPDALTNRWTGQSTVDIEVRPAEVRPGCPLSLAVRGIPAGVAWVGCSGGKLRGGHDAAYRLMFRGGDTWWARLPVAYRATAGAIRLCLYVPAGGGRIVRHDITAGWVADVVLGPLAPQWTAGWSWCLPPAASGERT